MILLLIGFALGLFVGACLTLFAVRITRADKDE